MNERLLEHQLDDIRIVGYSVAGEETVIAAPELNVCFDIGKAPAEVLPVDHVLLSHGHMDHSAGVAYYLSQRNFVGNAPGTILAPTRLVDPIKNLLQVWGQIEGHVTPAKIVGLQPGDEYQIRRGLVVRAFRNNHGVPSIGFVVIDVRRKLKPELLDKSGPELVALKKQGVEIEYTVEVPLIAYCGDTADGDWTQYDMVQKARVLILECTFFEADHVKRARAGYHMHVRDVARIIARLENPHFLLTHVTRRTAMGQAKRTLRKLVSEETYSRVTFLMDRRKGKRVSEPATEEGPAAG
ncbi:MAG TPA: MBL fold metallo-hydrolase [Phycisphaerae bacterium]|nr:MBL fold metallo-hydrolase [Phycisphaerae bacterium]